MSVLILPQRFAQQPQQAAPVETGHPLARRLVSYQPMSRRPGADAVDGGGWTVVESGSPFTLDAGPRGRGMRVKGATPAYIWRPVPAAITSGTTQPISFRFRLLFRSIGVTNTAIMSWGSNPQDGSPRFYMRLNGGSQLEFFFAGGYHSDFNVPVVAGREYLFGWDCDGINHRGELNGVPLPGTSASGWAGNGAAFYLGMGFDGSNAGTDFLLSDFAAWDRSRPSSESASDTQNPWQMLKAPPRRLWLATVGGAATYSYTSAGGIVFSGSTSKVRGVAKAPSGGIQLAGAAAAARGAARTPAGGLLLAGTAPLRRGRASIPTGGLKVAGAAGTAFAALVQSRVVSAAGGLLLRGLAALSRTMRRVASGGFAISGSAPATGTATTPVAPTAVFCQSSLMRAVATNCSVAARSASLAASGTMRALMSTSSIMRPAPINAAASMSGAALNMTAKLL